MNYKEYLKELDTMNLEALEKLTELQSDCIVDLADEIITLNEKIQELEDYIQ